MGIITDLEALLEPLLGSNGVELVDVQLAAEPGGRVLRVFIDTPAGVTLDVCERVSGMVGTALDERADIIPGRYVLEVSSPGLDRVIKKESDFRRFVGRKARINVFAPIDGQRHFTGELKGCAGGTVTIADASGRTVAIPLDGIARARLEPEL